jgi:hypothetical protein
MTEGRTPAEPPGKDVSGRGAAESAQNIISEQSRCAPITLMQPFLTLLAKADRRVFQVKKC